MPDVYFIGCSHSDKILLWILVLVLVLALSGSFFTLLKSLQLISRWKKSTVQGNWRCITPSLDVLFGCQITFETVDSFWIFFIEIDGEKIGEFYGLLLSRLTIQKMYHCTCLPIQWSVIGSDLIYKKKDAGMDSWWHLRDSSQSIHKENHFSRYVIKCLTLPL